jgi:hypothetical protein
MKPATNVDAAGMAIRGYSETILIVRNSLKIKRYVKFSAGGTRVAFTTK